MAAIAVGRRFGMPRTGSKSLALLAFMSFIDWTGVSIMGPLLPLYAIRLHATPGQLGLPVSLFAFTGIIGALVAGLFMDRLGTKRFLISGTAVYAIGNSLLATAVALPGLVAFRAIAGLGEGSTLASSRNYVARTTEEKRLAFANGTLSAAESGGRIAGPVLGGLVATLGDIRLPFLMIGITSFMACAASLLLPKLPKETAQPGRANQVSVPLVNGFNILLLVTQFLFLCANGAVFTIYSPFAVQGMSWSMLEVGLLVSVFSVGGVAVGMLVAMLADRTGRKRVAVVSLLLTAVWLTITALRLSAPLIFATGLVAGAGFTGYVGSWYALLESRVEPHARAKLLGVVLAVSNLGIMGGATITSLIWQYVSLGAAMYASAAMPVAAALVLLTVSTRARPAQPVLAQ